MARTSRPSGPVLAPIKVRRRWAPNAQAVFHSSDAGQIRLFFSDGAGGKRRVTQAGTPFVSEEYGDVSRDGSWVYFTGLVSGKTWTLWRVRADGTGAEQLLDDAGSGAGDWRGTLSPD